MQYDFDHILERRGTDSLKWDYPGIVFPHVPEGALPFWVADMDLPVAQPIIDALLERVRHPIYGYTIHQTEAYIATVVHWFARRFNWEIDPESLFYAPGIVTALGMFVQMLTEPGDGVIIQQPVYYPFAEMVRHNERTLLDNSLVRSGDRYTMNFDDLKKKARLPRTKLLILCSPHNPVGRVWTESELRQLIGICAENDVIVISDEIHCDILRRGVRHHPLAKVAPQYADHIIMATSPGKTFNIPGLKMANLVIQNPRLQRLYRRFCRQLAIEGSTVFGGHATRAAYKDGEEWLEQVLDYLDGNLDFLARRLHEDLPQARLIHPEGTYLAWIDVSAYGPDHATLKDLVLRKGKIILDDGLMFGTGGDGFMRINFGCGRSLLREGLRRLAEALTAPQT